MGRRNQTPGISPVGVLAGAAKPKRIGGDAEGSSSAEPRTPDEYFAELYGFAHACLGISRAEFWDGLLACEVDAIGRAYRERCRTHALLNARAHRDPASLEPRWKIIPPEKANDYYAQFLADIDKNIEIKNGTYQGT